jgi:hypothetical protein
MPTFRNTLSHLHRQVGVEWLDLRNVEIFIWEKVWLESSLIHPLSYWLRVFSSQIFSSRFGSKIAWATLLPIGSGYFRAKSSPVWTPQQFSNLVFLHLLAYEDGTVSRNVGIQNWDAGELPRRKHTTYRARSKFEIKNLSFSCSLDIWYFRFRSANK